MHSWVQRQLGLLRCGEGDASGASAAALLPSEPQDAADSDDDSPSCGSPFSCDDNAGAAGDDNTNT
eukprot:3395785-Rhodomonas_salina.1